MKIIKSTKSKNEQKLMCSNCGKSVPLSGMTMYNGSLLCRDCNSNRKAKEAVVIPRPIPANIPSPSALDEDFSIGDDFKFIAKFLVALLIMGWIVMYVCSNL